MQHLMRVTMALVARHLLPACTLLACTLLACTPPACTRPACTPPACTLPACAPPACTRPALHPACLHPACLPPPPPPRPQPACLLLRERQALRQHMPRQVLQQDGVIVQELIAHEAHRCGAWPLGCPGPEGSGAWPCTGGARAYLRSPRAHQSAAWALVGA